MKIYQKTLLALEQNATPNSKQNKFSKLSIEAQDPTLKELTKRVAQMYAYYIKPGWSRNIPFDSPRQANVPLNNQEWHNMQNTLNRELHSYVTAQIAQHKPEWQVTAEKHGWRPPN